VSCTPPATFTCNTSTLGINITPFPPITFVNGEVVSYMVSITDPVNDFNNATIGCDATGLTVTFTCPGPDGLESTNPADTHTLNPTNFDLIVKRTTPYTDTANAVNQALFADAAQTMNQTCTLNITQPNTPCASDADCAASNQQCMTDPALGKVCKITEVRASAQTSTGKVHQSALDVTARAFAEAAVPFGECKACVDKEVSCDGGVTFHDIGCVTADTDISDSCASWNAHDTVPAENIVVRHSAMNTGTVDLFNCSVTESNTLISSSVITFGNIAT